MYSNIQQNGICGASDNNNTQRLKAFQRALKNVPGYTSVKLPSENLEELLGIYNNSFKCQISGKTQEETFHMQAESYIKNYIKNSITPTPDTERDLLTEDAKNLLGNFKTGSEAIGAEVLSSLNKIDLHIQNTRKIFG